MKKAIYQIRDRELPEQIAKRIPEEWSGGSFIPPGWRNIVCMLDDELAEIDPNYEIHQVKEKFGTLRFYFDHVNMEDEKREKFDEVIRKYEAIADNACEVCGQPGERGATQQLIFTRCKHHKE